MNTNAKTGRSNMALLIIAMFKKEQISWNTQGHSDRFSLAQSCTSSIINQNNRSVSN